MKRFSLDEYLKNPSKKVITRDGRPVRIICTDRKGSGGHPVVALYPNWQEYLGEIVCTFCANGEFTMGIESDYDLFFAPEKHEGWINIYRSESRFYLRGNPYKSNEEADEVAKANYKNFCTTVKIEWEE